MSIARIALLLARFTLSAWVGATTLFVMVGVREIRHPGFDSIIRNELVLLRFPSYYAFGFPLLAVAAICLVVLLWRGVRTRRLISASVLTIAALSIMACDYPLVYRPLARMISPPGQARPATFVRLHRLSWQINAVQLGCALAAALLVCSAPDPDDGQNTRNIAPP